LLLDTLVKNPQRRNALLHGAKTIPSLKKKVEWIDWWMDPKNHHPFRYQQLAFIIVEGLLFSASFCAIFWVKKRGKMPGLAFANAEISRDEELHFDFGCHLYSHLQHQLTESEAHKMVKSAVAMEEEFVREALPLKLVGMNADLMIEYVHWMADRLCLKLHYQPIYNVKRNPILWMENISLGMKTNFFENRAAEYQMGGICIPSPTPQRKTMTQQQEKVQDFTMGDF